MMLIAIMLLIVGLSSQADAACSGASPTWTAASTSYAEVSACVTAASSGDTINIPGGTSTWNTRLVISSKSLWLKGAGAGTEAQCATGGQTTYTCITMGTPTNGLIEWTLIPTGLSKISGITLDGGTGTSCGDNDGLVNLSGDTANWASLRNRFISRRCHGLQVHEFVRGVDTSYHERRDNHFSAYVHHGKWNNGNTCPNYPGGCGDSAWADDTNYGTGAFFVFEDCTMERGGSGAVYGTDGWKGSRFVVRLCTMLNSTVNDHGTDSSGRARGARAKEVYGNQFTFDNISISAVMSARGGTAMFWGNEVTTGGGQTVTRCCDVTHYRVLEFQGSGECSYWGCADDSANNNFDEGSGTGNGYAAMDQAGRGKGDLISGDEYVSPCSGTPKCGVTPVGWPNQALEPVYAWNNNKDGANSALSRNGGSNIADYLQENRDYYTEGSLNGVKGSGARASRPSTCTTGEAYWSTDGGGNWNTSTSNPAGVQLNGADGALDKCTATNTWTNDAYVPYTYPHPLNVSDEGSGDGTTSIDAQNPQGTRSFSPMINLFR